MPFYVISRLQRLEPIKAVRHPAYGRLIHVRAGDWGSTVQGGGMGANQECSSAVMRRSSLTMAPLSIVPQA